MEIADEISVANSLPTNGLPYIFLLTFLSQYTKEEMQAHYAYTEPGVAVCGSCMAWLARYKYLLRLGLNFIITGSDYISGFQNTEF